MEDSTLQTYSTEQFIRLSQAQNCLYDTQCADYIWPHVVTSAHSCPHVQTSANICPHVPTSANICPRLPTSGHMSSNDTKDKVFFIKFIAEIEKVM